MLRSILVGVAGAGLLIAGALTSLASNSHGTAVRHLATSSTLTGEARGDAVGALAKGVQQAATVATSTSATTQAQSQADVETETDTETAEAADDDNAAPATDEDAHGDAVSVVAKSDNTAAHENDKVQSNHGGAVSEAAEKD